ncbi:MAG: hypothetical protein N2255_01465, partial [Kiritimatiellae bacterium]|nr:hypothetical protein [Kiritimatiellia bacterium]
MTEIRNILIGFLACALLLVFLGWMYLKSRTISPRGEENPFAYSVQEFARTDPALVRYEQKTSFKCGFGPVTGIAVDGSDRIFVVSPLQLRIFDRDGAEQALFNLTPEKPRECVAVAPGGDILVGAHDRVEVYDLNGRKTAEWPPFGERAHITSISTLSEEVFIADAGTRCIWHCDRQGHIKRRIGGNGREKVEGVRFIVPSPYFDVVADPRGCIWVANPGELRVEQFTLEGQWLSSWGRSGMDIQGFCGCCNPIHLALLPDGGLVTSEKGLPRVKTYGRDGTFVGVVAGTE